MTGKAIAPKFKKLLGMGQAESVKYLETARTTSEGAII